VKNDQPIQVTMEMFPPLGTLNGNTIFYSITALAFAMLLIALVCLLHPHLQHHAKQSMFVGLVGGLLSLGLLSTFLILHVMHYPWSILLFFCVGFALFSGLFFLSQLVSGYLATIRARHP
jgi:hypothetical protein